MAAAPSQISQIVIASTPEVWRNASSRVRSTRTRTLSTVAKSPREQEKLAEDGTSAGDHAGSSEQTSTLHGLTGALSSAIRITQHLLRGLLCVCAMLCAFDALWVAVSCALPMFTCLALRFLFSPARAGGSVDSSAFTWWTACYVVTATLTYGGRLVLREFLRTRFTCRAQVTVAHAVGAAGDNALQDDEVELVGQSVRDARRFVLEHAPEFLVHILQMILLAFVCLAHSGLIGGALVGLLVAIMLAHLLEDALHAQSAVKLHKELLASDKIADPVARVHQLAAVTHSATVWRAALRTSSMLLQFASPLVFLFCILREIEAETEDTQDEFQLLLAFTCAIGAMLACRAAHEEARDALDCVDALLHVAELDLDDDGGQEVLQDKPSPLTRPSRCADHVRVMIVVFGTITGPHVRLQTSQCRITHCSQADHGHTQLLLCRGPLVVRRTIDVFCHTFLPHIPSSTQSVFSPCVACDFAQALQRSPA